MELKRAKEVRMFYSCPWDVVLGGYPVKYLNGFLVAIFVQENEAADYALYRNQKLSKYNTTDVDIATWMRDPEGVVGT